MKLTSLGCGKDTSKELGLACHLLDANQCCVLLECPLDLSALALFLPASLSTHSALHTRRSSGATIHGPDVHKKASSRDSIAAAGHKRVSNRDVQQDVLLRPSTAIKRIRLNHEEHGDEGAGENGRDRVGVYKEWSSLFKEINGQVLPKGEPWYKIAGLELVDVGLLDAVIKSNPSGMLGLLQ